MDAAEIVDRAATSRVVVIGSLPPDGRDLDLLLDPADVAPAAAALEREGFSRNGAELVRFAELSAYAVELSSWTDWSLPETEWRALAAEARPIGSYARLVRPAPGHALLLLARKLAGERRPLREKHRRRIASELAGDAGAWAAAAAAAPAWRLEEELARFRLRYESGRGIRIARPRRGAVVAFSGLDGSGKSTQTRALASALERLGWETEVVWVPLGSSRTLQQVARTGKRLLARARGADPDRAEGERMLWSPAGSGGTPPPGKAAAAAAWSTAGTAANALAHLRAAGPALAAGKVVIFDRYVLDTVVHLRFTYGGRPHPVQERLVRALSPAPLAAFLLDIPPAEAAARKRDWPLDVLERQAELYRAEFERHGARRLDALRPPEDLAAEIGVTVLERLRATP